MKSKFDKYDQIKIAISYNEKIGGVASDSVKKVFLQQQIKLVETDYRSIVAVSNNLETLDPHDNELIEVFKKAKERAEQLLKGLDALIIPGNDARIDPRLYDMPLTPHTKKTDNARAIGEMALVHVAMHRGMPILGICGGHQIINVYLGGTVKDLSDEDLDAQGYMQYSEVGFHPKSELAKIFFANSENRKTVGRSKIFSHYFFGAHRQVVDVLGNVELSNDKDLISSVAIADDSSFSCEAFEANYGSPLYSVQFHPEVGAVGMYSFLFKGIRYQAQTGEDIKTNNRIFDAFIQAAVTFHLKKILVRDTKLKMQKENDSEVDSQEEYPDDEKENISFLDSYSIFKRAKTKHSKLKVTHHVIPERSEESPCIG